jgi:hypothetical protein
MPAEPPETDTYAPTVESMSDKWRGIQTAEQTKEAPSQLSQKSAPKSSIMLGVGIGIAIVIFLAMVGGFLLLVWTVNR